MPLRDLFVGSGTRTSLVALLSAVALVLLVGCANIAGLLAAPGLSRPWTKSCRSTTWCGGPRRRLDSQLVLSFGGLAPVLAAVGIFGTLSYLVCARQREIGICLALGASRAVCSRPSCGRG